jgi:hypothetical protein
VTSDAPHLLAGSGDDADTSTGADGPPPSPSSDTRPATTVAPVATPATLPSGSGPRLTICPYLATEGGAWRAAIPVREHECGAVDPPVQLALDKQRRLCLTAAHTTCATYLAAGDLRDRAAGRGWGPTGTTQRRPVPITTPVLIDRGRGSPLNVPFFESNRLGGQALLVGLLVIAFIAIALARLESGPAATPVPSFAAVAGSPQPSAVATQTVTPSTPASASPSASPSPAHSPKPSATPKLSGRTYTVKSGDTLSGIAAKFGVTVAALKKANKMTSNVIHPGQILKLP